MFDIRVNPPSTIVPNPAEFAGYEQRLPHMKTASPFIGKPLSEFVKAQDEVGITKALIIVGPFAVIEDPAKHIADLVSEYPERFIGGIPIKLKPNLMDSVRELERAVKEFGIRAIMLRPFDIMMYANDRRLYPLYAKCAELGAVVSIVVGVNYTIHPNLEFGNPIAVDTVASSFPDLKIICTHSGWPWATEAVAVALKNNNVYIDIAGIAPRYIAMDGTGYEPLFRFGNSVLRNKILWGSDWPLIDLKRSTSEVLELPLKDEVRERWTYTNAMELFDL